MLQQLPQTLRLRKSSARFFPLALIDQVYRQTIANTGFVAPGLDAKQLAVLQQLALAQTASSAAPSAPSQPGPHVVPAHAPSGSAYPTPSSIRDESYNTLQKDRSYDRRHSPERVKPYGDQPDDRLNSRGSFRGGPPRGRGRGDARSNRWDDRDRDRYVDRERDWNPLRGRRSRSRSPLNRHGGKRDIRPYSPPSRPSIPPTMPRSQRDTFDSGTADSGKDEFGRDLRPQSPDSDTTSIPKNQSPQSPPTSNHSEHSSHRERPTIDPPPAITSNHERMSLSPLVPLVAANTSNTPSVPIISNIVSTNPGMESFDPVTFNFTSPSSWEVLGKMWQVTHGYLPTAEQLMEFVISSGQPSMVAQQAPENAWSQPSSQVWRGASRGRGSFTRGRGGFGNGNTRNVQEEWTHNNNGNHQPTDAIVLGETTNSDLAGINDGQNSPAQNPSGGPGGRMQRIGDKWVFVRDPTMGVS